MAVCATCGFENPDGFRFCGSCGAGLVAEPAGREERKVVTVFFADVVGFTSRAERLDPEDVRAVLSSYHARLRAELERYGGTVEKFIGDAVMAIFGAPVAHEDDPERAVRAALAIRDGIAELNEREPSRELHVRIGITTGEALVALEARPEAGEGMAAGDVVNTAARLQSAAPVDGILVDETTFRATDRAISYREAPAVDAKGKAEPVPAWEAAEARARFGVDVAREARTPLVGRQHEIDVLRDALARVRRDRATQLVTLVGVPGIGKSRLVLELLGVVDADPELITWRQGRSLPYGEGVSFWALGEMVKAQAGILETDSDDDAAEKLGEAVTNLVEEPDEAPWVERHLGRLVGLGGEERGSDQGEAFAAWRRFFEALAESGPAVLVFEDLHWADEGLLDFVEHLVDWAGSVPLLVVCIARPELLARRPGWGGGKPNATTLSLAPLSDEETAHLLTALLQQAVMPAELQSLLLDRAGGNPLYAEEFVRMVGERGLEDPDALLLPESVQGIIAARLDGLPPEDKALLQDAAVLGKVFWLGATAAIGDTARRDAERRLHELERRQLVRRERHSSVAGETEYVFWHVLVRDVAYAQIPRARRADKHRRAAEWIGSLSPERAEDRADLLAHHYLAALEFARAAGEDDASLGEQARVALRAAGDRALSLYAYASAARFYREAVELWPADDADRAYVLLGLGRALNVTEERGATEVEAARDAFVAAGNAEGAGEAASLLSEIAWMAGDVRRSLDHVEHATKLVADLPPSPSKADVLGNRARLLMLSGRLEEAIEAGREALAMAEALGVVELRAHALNSIGTARASLGDRQGLADLEQSIEIAETVGAHVAIRGYINLASVTAASGDMRRARELHERGIAAARRLGQARGLRFLRAELIVDQCFLGDWDVALPAADAFIAEVEAGSPHYMEHACRFVRALIRLAREDDAGATSDIERTLELGREQAEPQVLVPALAMRALVAVDTGDDGLASACLDELIATQADQTGYWVFPGVFVADLLGRLDDLGALLPEAPPFRWEAVARLYVTGDRSAAADELAKIGSLTDEARARLRAAEVFAREGNRPAAERERAAAVAFYTRVGATRYLRLAEQLLAATG
jgi:class 3 adenylate cyclase/tetratricopeptide (TPR) repeat protein